MRFFWVFQVLVIVLAPSLVYGWRNRHDPSRALRGGGLILVATYTMLFGLFAAGSALADPGGWIGVAITAAWLIPLVGLSVLSWRRPGIAVTVLLGLMLGFAALCTSSALAPDWWTAFEDDRGPIRGLIALALVAPVGVLGWHHPRIGGSMLIALPVLPALAVVVAVLQGADAEGWPVAVFSAPTAIAGAAYLRASSFAGSRLTARSRELADAEWGDMNTRWFTGVIAVVVTVSAFLLTGVYLGLFSIVGGLVAAVVGLGGTAWWIRTNRHRGAATTARSAVTYVPGVPIGLMLTAAGVAITWLGGTGHYPGVDPAGASNSTTLALMVVGTAIAIVGLATALLAGLRRRR